MANNVTVVGALQNDPELRFTPNGNAVVSVTVRDSKPVKKGEKRQDSYFDVTIWGDLAEHVAESLEKGDRVICVGKLEQQKWETAEGEKRSKIQVVAWNFGPDLSYASATVVRNEAAEEQAPAEVSAGF